MLPKIRARSSGSVIRRLPTSYELGSVGGQRFTLGDILFWIVCVVEATVFALLTFHR